MWDDIISAVKLVDDDIEGGRSMLQVSNRIEFKAELNDKLEKEIGAILNNKEGGVCARRRKQKRRGGFHIRPQCPADRCKNSCISSKFLL